MTQNTLEDVYRNQLQDIWSSNKQALSVLNELHKATKDAGLSKALVAGSSRINDAKNIVEAICSKHNIVPDGEHCKGMEGIVAEAKAHILQEDYGDDDLRDAIIIMQYQRIVHYALTGYGGLVAFAYRLGYDDDGAVLQDCLAHTCGGAKTMTSIARGVLNENAA